MEAAVLEHQEAGHEDAPDAAVAHRERVRPEQECGPHLVLPKGRALADRMASQQVELQRADVRVGDGDVRQLPETRLDAIRERALRDDLLEGATARVDALCGSRGESHGLPFAGHGDHVIQVEGPAVDRTHGDRRGIPVPRYSSGAHLLRTTLKVPPVLKRSRRAKETRNGGRPGTAMELRSLRGRGLDGFDDGSPSSRILLPPPGSREGLRWRMPDVGRTEIGAASCRARLRTR